MKYVKAVKLTKTQLAYLYYIWSCQELITYSGTGSIPLKNLEKLGMVVKVDCTLPSDKAKVFSWKLTSNGKLYLVEVEEEACTEAYERGFL